MDDARQSWETWGEKLLTGVTRQNLMQYPRFSREKESHGRARQGNWGSYFVVLVLQGCSVRDMKGKVSVPLRCVTLPWFPALLRKKKEGEKNRGLKKA
jgi:hypothetical protein